MKYKTLQQLAPCMVATVIAFATGSASGQEIIGETIEMPSPPPLASTPYESIPAPSAQFESTFPSAPLESTHFPSAPYESAPFGSTPIDSDSYVGDIACDGATCCDSGKCDSGTCTSGKCGSGSCCGGICGKLCGKLCGKQVGDIPVSTIIPRRYGQPDLFYNYYTQGNANQVNAQMYLSPLPVPPNVGHTFFTYQPFYPEEMLYCHKNRFHRYYDNGRGMNRTHATYYSPPIRQAMCNLYWNYLRLPR